MKQIGKVLLLLAGAVLTAGVCAAQRRSTNQFQLHAPFVNGQVLMDTGQPVSESVLVELMCGADVLQVVHTDSKGYFQFDLGAGRESPNMDSSSFAPVNGMNLRQGCEVLVTVPGFQPLFRVITAIVNSGIDSEIDVGPLQLERIAGVKESAISVTSLLVPSSARKEFDKGVKEARSNRLELATQHLEKAVAEYDKYAAAWNELGNVFLANREIEKSRQAFEKAIAGDSHYIPAYVGLAALRLQTEEYESAVETAGKALEMDPRIGLASFIQAKAYFRLNRLDAAERSGRNAGKESYQEIPELHVLLTAIFLAKQDMSNAVAQIRAYLKNFPQGQFVGEMKAELKQIEQSTGERQ